MSEGDPLTLSAGVSALSEDADPARGGWTFPLVLTVAFLGVGLVNVLTHEMWSDEMQAWLLARDSDSLAGLFHNLRYEGHPALWYLGLYALTRFTHQPEAMQVYHLLIATAAIFVFAKWSPFTRLAKVLFVFGYFPLYEYATISRNYAFGVLFLFIFCALAGPRRRKNYVLLALMLFMMMQSSMYALLVAGPLAGMLVVEMWWDRGVRASLAARKTEVITGVVIFLAGVGLSFLQTSPPADSDCYSSWRTGFYPGAVATVLSAVWNSYVPLPQLTTRFWETNIVPWLAVKAVLGVMLLVAGVWLFRRRRDILFLYVASAATVMGLQYVKFFGGMRHHGHLFLALVACLWLTLRSEKEEASEATRSDRDAGTERKMRFVGPALIVFFGLHMVVGVYASAVDWFCSFSPAKAAAEYIRAEGLEDHIIAGSDGNRMCPIVGYLDIRYFTLYGCHWGSFRVYAMSARPNRDLFYRRLAEMQAAQKKDILLVLTPREPAPPGYVKIAEFPPVILRGEEHYILGLLKYKPPDGSP